MKNNILLIPDSDYLSNPLFLELAKVQNRNLQLIYLNPSIPLTKGSKKENFCSQDLISSFDQYEKFDDYYFDYFKDYLNKSIFNKFIAFPKFVTNFRNYIEKVFGSFEKLSPSAIVITSDKALIGIIANHWAAKSETPVIVIQSAFLEIEKVSFFKKIKRFLIYLIMNRILKLPFESKQHDYGHENKKNFVFIWGEYFQKNFKNDKIGERLRLTGNPLFDKYSKSDFTRSKLIDELADKKPVVSIFTTPYLDILNKAQEEEVAETYKHLINGNPQWFFVLKIHPRQDTRFYERLLESSKCANYLITKTINIDEVFYSSDVQISMFSYTSFQAVIAGTPIIMFKDEFINFHDSFNNEIELRANNLSELEKSISYAITPEFKEEFRRKRIKYLNSRIVAMDGKSSERVLHEIEKIVIKAN